MDSPTERNGMSEHISTERANEIASDLMWHHYGDDGDSHDQAIRLGAETIRTLAKQRDAAVELVEVLGKALADLVGSDEPKELDGMELVVRSSHVIESEKATEINAIDAVRKWLEHKAALATKEEG